MALHQTHGTVLRHGVRAEALPTAAYRRLGLCVAVATVLAALVKLSALTLPGL